MIFEKEKGEIKAPFLGCGRGDRKNIPPKAQQVDEDSFTKFFSGRKKILSSSLGFNGNNKIWSAHVREKERRSRLE